MDVYFWYIINNDIYTMILTISSLNLNTTLFISVFRIEI